MVVHCIFNKHCKCHRNQCVFMESSLKIKMLCNSINKGEAIIQVLHVWNGNKYHEW